MYKTKTAVLYHLVEIGEKTVKERLDEAHKWVYETHIRYETQWPRGRKLVNRHLSSRAYECIVDDCGLMF
jgi:hypothetical protein